ncbi:uncharacterized protein [Panulirus ornatus]|uniref:uncharacterized protein n=1 Tax=Panulirus ornatus TaxID=150431 RepID=UPI003A8B0CC1
MYASADPSGETILPTVLTVPAVPRVPQPQTIASFVAETVAYLDTLGPGPTSPSRGEDILNAALDHLRQGDILAAIRVAAEHATHVTTSCGSPEDRQNRGGGDWEVPPTSVGPERLNPFWGALFSRPSEPDERAITDCDQEYGQLAGVVTVDLPESAPVLDGAKTSYQLEEGVTVNCTSLYSKPAATLEWYINDELVTQPEFLRRYEPQKEPDGLETAVLGLTFKTNRSHFPRGEMRLKCVAMIATIYFQSQETSVIETGFLPHTQAEERRHNDRFYFFGCGKTGSQLQVWCAGTVPQCYVWCVRDTIPMCEM